MLRNPFHIPTLQALHWEKHFPPGKHTDPIPICTAFTITQLLQISWHLWCEQPSQCCKKLSQAHFVDLSSHSLHLSPLPLVEAGMKYSEPQNVVFAWACLFWLFRITINIPAIWIRKSESKYFNWNLVLEYIT